MKYQFLLFGLVVFYIGLEYNQLEKIRLKDSPDESSDWVVNLRSILLKLFLPIDGTEAMREIVEAATQNTSKLADTLGYSVSEHFARTEDGYLLTLFHILGERKKGIRTGTLPPVLVQHGIFGTSDMWVSNGNDSLAFVLANAGYDVWMGNFRGNVYSRRHDSKTAGDPSFWDFSIDELIAFDLPAMVGHVLSRSAGDRLLFVGHSMGATVALALLADQPQFNSLFHLVVALAPVITFAYSPSFSRPLAENFQFTEYILKDVFGFHEGFSRSLLSLHAIFTWCPSNNPSFCSRVINRICGIDKELLNQTLIPKYFYLSTCGGSVNQMLQFSQTIKKNPGFFHLDRRRMKNVEADGQVKPTEYDLSLVTSPVAIYFGQNDALADPLDITWLVRQLSKVVVDQMVPHPLYNHLDFIWAKNNLQLLYSDIIDLLDEASRTGLT